MKYLIIVSMFTLTACSNHVRDTQNTRSNENPTLHTVGHIGNIEVKVGFADIKE